MASALKSAKDPSTVTRNSTSVPNIYSNRPNTSATTPSSSGTSSTQPKKRKRNDGAATQNTSAKKSRQESSDEGGEQSMRVKKEASRKTTVNSKPAAMAESTRWICDRCGVDQSSKSNKKRHQKSETCQKLAHERKYGVKKTSPTPASKQGAKQESKPSSPDPQKSATAGESPRSRLDSVSTKRTSVSPGPEKSIQKDETYRVATSPSKPTEQAKEPTPTAMPIGLNNMRGVSVSAQNAALQILFHTFTDKEIEQLCAGEEPKMFNLKPEELLKYDSPSRPKKRSMFDMKLKEAKDKIVKTVLTPEELTDEQVQNPQYVKPAIALGPYIGQLFKKMREAERSGEKIELTAMMVQTTFALSGKKFRESIKETGVDLQTALDGRKYLDVLEENQNEDAGGYLTNLTEALGREHHFILEKFKMKTHFFGHCDKDNCDGKHQELKTSFALKATVPAEKYDLAIDEDDGDVYETEIRNATGYIIQEAVKYDDFRQVICPVVDADGEPCEGEMEVKPCVIQYPDYLLVPLEREDAEAPLHTVNLISTMVGDQKYRMTGMIQADDKTDHNVAFREVEKKWWKLRDEDVESATPAQLQDSVRRKCVLILMQKV